MSVVCLTERLIALFLYKSDGSKRTLMTLIIGYFMDALCEMS